MRRSLNRIDKLHDLARLDNALDLLDDERTDTHFDALAQAVRPGTSHGALTLFPDQAVIAVVRVVGIPRNRTSSIADDSEIELYQDDLVRLRGSLETERRGHPPRNSWPNRPECPELRAKR